MNARLIRWAALACLIGLAAGCDKDRAEAIRAYNRGIEVASAGGVDSAYSYFFRATRLDPTLHRSFYEMALIDLYDRAGLEAKAISNLRKAEALRGDDRDVLYQLGRTLVTTGNKSEGFGYLDRAIKADPNYAPAHYFMGVSLVAMGRFVEADRAFREAVAINPEELSAFRDLGELYESFDHFDAAKDVYDEGLRHNPGAVDLLNRLGLLAMRQGQAKEGIALFEKAKSLDGARGTTIFNLAFAHLTEGNHREAYRNLGEYINQAGPDEAENTKIAMLLRDNVLDKLRAAKQAKEDAEAEGRDAP